MQCHVMKRRHMELDGVEPFAPPAIPSLSSGGPASQPALKLLTRRFDAFGARSHLPAPHGLDVNLTRAAARHAKQWVQRWAMRALDSSGELCAPPSQSVDWEEPKAQCTTLAHRDGRRPCRRRRRRRPRCCCSTGAGGRTCRR